MPEWRLRPLEFGTVFCETELAGAELWLEWNERVFAYRFGYRRGEFVSSSVLGYCDSLEAAQALAVAAVLERQ